MKKIISSFICLIIINCVSVNKSRAPDSVIDSYDFTTIDIDEFEKFYKTALRYESGKKYRILRYPISSVSDVENGSEIENTITEVMSQITEISLIYDYEWEEYQLIKDRLITLIGDYVRPKILSRITEEEKRKLLKFYFGPKGVDDYFEMGFFITMKFHDFNFFVTEEDIVNALKFIPNSPEGVYYNGRKGWHVYDDKELEYHIQVLTLAISLEKDKFIKIFDSQEESIRAKFRHNSHGMDEKDKVEPFDLLSSYLTWHIVAAQYDTSFGHLNKIYIGKLIQKSMSRLFEMFEIDPESDKLPTMSVMKKEDRVLFWCANGRFKSRSRFINIDNSDYGFIKEYGNDILDGMTPAWKLSQLPEIIEKGYVNSTFYCNTMEYKTTIRLKKAEPINPPRPIDYSNQDNIDVFITVALVSEMNFLALNLGKIYLGLIKGWELVDDFKEVDTKSKFNDLLPKADIYIPVSHLMDVNTFHVGTVKGNFLKLRKTITYKDGQIKTVNLNILFPKSEEGLGSAVYMNPESLSDLLLKRSELNKQPLFLMNTSCRSEQTLFTWLVTHRKVLRKKMKFGLISNLLEDNSTPHIIGSKQYFDTASISSILSHLHYPLGTIEMLAKGETVSEVVEFLKQEKEQETSIMSLFFGKRTTSKKENTHFVESFQPDYIMDHPELLNFGGYQIYVNRRGFPTEREY